MPTVRHVLRPHVAATALFALAFACVAPGSQSDPGAAETQASGPAASEPNAAVVVPQNANVAGAANVAQAANTAPAPAAAIPGAATRYVGRIDAVTDSSGPILAWPGTQILIGFAGTKLTVSLGELDTTTYDGQRQNNAFDVTIDGAAAPRVTLAHGTTSYVVASGLSRGQHQAVLTKRTEGQIGRVQHLGSSTDGSLTFTSPVSARRIEFIGDSGTAGYGAEGNFPCTFTAATENAAVAYPTQVGALLSAEVHSISFSGKGVVQNRDMVNDAEKTLPVLWTRTLPNDENVLTYKPESWQPQVVVMTLGGNDFYVGILSQAEFVAKVTAFISTLRKAYPAAHIYLGVSPMLRDDIAANERDTGLAYARASVAAAASDHVHYLDLPADLGANGYGCDEHMSPGTHRLEAAAIAAAIRGTQGW